MFTVGVVGNVKPDEPHDLVIPGLFVATQDAPSTGFQWLAAMMSRTALVLSVDSSVFQCTFGQEAAKAIQPFESQQEPHKKTHHPSSVAARRKNRVDPSRVPQWQAIYGGKQSMETTVRKWVQAIVRSRHGDETLVCEFSGVDVCEQLSFSQPSPDGSERRLCLLKYQLKRDKLDLSGSSMGVSADPVTTLKAKKRKTPSGWDIGGAGTSSSFLRPSLTVRQQFQKVVETVRGQTDHAKKALMFVELNQFVNQVGHVCNEGKGDERSRWSPTEQSCFPSGLVVEGTSACVQGVIMVSHTWELCVQEVEMIQVSAHLSVGHSA